MSVPRIVPLCDCLLWRLVQLSNSVVCKIGVSAARFIFICCVWGPFWVLNLYLSKLYSELIDSLEGSISMRTLCESILFGPVVVKFWLSSDDCGFVPPRLSSIKASCITLCFAMISSRVKPFLLFEFESCFVVMTSSCEISFAYPPLC